MSKASDLARLLTSGSTSLHGEAGVTASGSTGLTTNLQQGLAKAWIDISSDLASILDSYNISSLDDDGTGDGGINLTSSMGSANYTITASSEDNGASASIINHDVTQGTKTASGYDFEAVFVNASANRTNTDCKTMSAIHGDLA